MHFYFIENNNNIWNEIYAQVSDIEMKYSNFQCYFTLFEKFHYVHDDSFLFFIFIIVVGRDRFIIICGVKLDRTVQILRFLFQSKKSISSKYNLPINGL